MEGKALRFGEAAMKSSSCGRTEPRGLYGEGRPVTITATKRRVRKRRTMVPLAAMAFAASLVLALWVLNTTPNDPSRHVTSEATTNKTVLGVVYDQTSQPIAGADVTVEIWGGYWPDQDFFRTSESTVTDPSGYYEVTINSNYWDPHNTIKVTVTYGSDQKTHKVEADAEQYQTVNMFMDLVIPEFSGSLGLLAMMAGCAVPVVVMLARKRR